MVLQRAKLMIYNTEGQALEGKPESQLMLGQSKRDTNKWDN